MVQHKLYLKTNIDNNNINKSKLNHILDIANLKTKKKIKNKNKKTKKNKLYKNKKLLGGNRVFDYLNKQTEKVGNKIDNAFNPKKQPQVQPPAQMQPQAQMQPPGQIQSPGQIQPPAQMQPPGQMQPPAQMQPTAQIQKSEEKLKLHQNIFYSLKEINNDEELLKKIEDLYKKVTEIIKERYKEKDVEELKQIITIEIEQKFKKLDSLKNNLKNIFLLGLQKKKIVALKRLYCKKKFDKLVQDLNNIKGLGGMGAHTKRINFLYRRYGGRRAAVMEPEKSQTELIKFLSNDFYPSQFISILKMFSSVIKKTDFYKEIVSNMSNLTDDEYDNHMFKTSIDFCTLGFLT